MAGASDADDPASHDPVARAIAEIPRTCFVPAEQRTEASEDRPVTIGWSQTNSQPTTVANMLRLLEVRPGQRVLDVGAGSGWSTALLAALISEQGRVIGVERIPELAEGARAAVKRTGLGWATVRTAEPGVLGAPDEAPFDRILVSAEADRVPEELVDQLAEGGVLVVPVNSEMLRIRRTREGLETSRHGQYRFVPLITGQ